MWTVCKTKKERKEKIQKLLQENDKAVYRAILAIYSRQTEHEKNCDATHAENGIGFGAFDAEIMSSFAKQIQRGFTLTTKQMNIARPKIMRYHRQLAEIAEQREKQIVAANSPLNQFTE